MDSHLELKSASHLSELASAEVRLLGLKQLPSCVGNAPFREASYTAKHTSRPCLPWTPGCTLYWSVYTHFI